MLDIEQEDDDRTFLGYVHAVIDRILVEPVTGIYITKVDAWFGERWVGFAGKTLGAAGVHFRDELRIPPFVPNRVVHSAYLQRQASGACIAAPPPVALHLSQRSESEPQAESARHRSKPGIGLVQRQHGVERPGKHSRLCPASGWS